MPTRPAPVLYGCTDTPARVQLCYSGARAVSTTDVTDSTEKKSFEPTVSTTEAAQAQSVWTWRTPRHIQIYLINLNSCCCNKVLKKRRSTAVFKGRIY